MCHLNDMYWETYLSDRTNTKNCYFFKTQGLDEFLLTKWDRYNMK